MERVQFRPGPPWRVHHHFHDPGARQAPETASTSTTTASKSEVSSPDVGSLTFTWHSTMRPNAQVSPSVCASASNTAMPQRLTRLWTGRETWPTSPQKMSSRADRSWPRPTTVFLFASRTWPNDIMTLRTSQADPGNVDATTNSAARHPLKALVHGPQTYVIYPKYQLYTISTRSPPPLPKKK